MIPSPIAALIPEKQQFTGMVSLINNDFHTYSKYRQA